MKSKRINVIVTGATGMVGEGVLHKCLSDPRIASIILLTRRSTHVNHPRVKEMLLGDLSAMPLNQPDLANVDACFYCLGITSIKKTEEKYTEVTHDLTLTIAQSLITRNPGMTFCYISAKGSDNSEQGKTMWARVKGRTENDLAKIGFKQLYIFRPFMLTPIRGLQHSHGFYKYISWLFPFGRLVYPDAFCTLQELALAMIQVADRGYGKKIITPTDMVKIAR